MEASESLNDASTAVDRQTSGDRTIAAADAATGKALTAVAECAIALLGARHALIQLDNGEVLVSVGASGECSPVDKKAQCPDGHRSDEALVGAEGRHLGVLSVFGPAPQPMQVSNEAMLRRLALIATAILEQRASLESATRRFKDAFSQSPSPTWIYDPTTLRFLDVNETAIGFYGYSREEFLCMTVLDIRPPEERQRMLDAVRGQSDLDAASTWRHRRADGRPVDVITHGRQISFDGAEAVIVVAIDRTDVLSLRQDLFTTQLLLDTIIDALPNGLFLKDMEDGGRFVVMNPAAAHFVGMRPDQMLGRTSIEVFGADLGQKFTRHDREVMAAGRLLAFDSNDVINRNGECRQIHTMLKPLPAPGGQAPRYLLGMYEDVTERRKSADRIAHMAHYDFLTGLPNRVLFQKNLEDAAKRQKKFGSFAVLYIDLDLFKTINDTYGHPIGDALLKQVAARLKANLRARDLVARLGGDEFAILARVTGGEVEARELAHHILRGFDTPFDLGECLAHVDASIGIALARAPKQESGEALLRHADIALYAAKAEGRGIAKVYVERMREHVEARQMMSEDLRLATAEGQFELNYQPLHDLDSDLIVGFEALIRWHHPVRGLISPAEFIPVAEQTGLIVPIGEWVLREACRQAASWPDKLKVAVNLSAVQFRKPGLVATVELALALAGLPASRLELEITESVLLTDSGANLQTLHALRALGARIAMDDFGTGYSSLSYLRSFPFDKIKMDRSFVADVCEDDGSLAIVRAVTGLGASLSITTTAEGIETKEQFARLKAEGFDELQGYLIGRPMSAESALTLALSQSSRQEKQTAA